MRRLSPIERMIDEACGLKPGEIPTPIDPVTMRCPKCKKELVVARAEHDHPRAKYVETECPDCICSGTREEVMYFDADGAQLFFDEGAPR